MLPEVLIAYASRGGSTAEVAEALGASLREAGIMVQVQPMSQVESLTGWKALILGAPLYIGRFPGEFHSFFKRHRDTLDVLHPWCFVLGPTRNVPKDFEAARTQAEKQFKKYPQFHPVELRILGGKWDPNTMPFPFSLLRRLPANPMSKIPASDIRDWAAIREWAESIARQVRSAA
jgi:menaquinone-dependent protoporphyrinogen oxidase